MTLEEVFILQARTILIQGGTQGVLDQGLIESAVEAPRNYYKYELGSTRRLSSGLVAKLAACYWYHLTRNHGFVDGNKRIGFIAAKSFVVANGFSLKIRHDRAEALTLAVAAGSLDRAELMVEIVPEIA